MSEAAKFVLFRCCCRPPCGSQYANLFENCLRSTSDPLQVSQLLTARNFQKYSGPVLESLSMQQHSFRCFDFTAVPEAYPVTAHSASLVSVLSMQHLHPHAVHMQPC